MPALKNCSTLLQIKVRLQFTSQTWFSSPPTFLFMAVSMGDEMQLVSQKCRNQLVRALYVSLGFRRVLYAW